MKPRTDLQAARVKIGLTQTELARRIGRDQSTVSKYEAGGIAVEKEIAPALADALGLSVLDVLYPPANQAEAA